MRKNEWILFVFVMIIVHKPYETISNISFLIKNWPRTGDKATSGDNRKVFEKWKRHFIIKLRNKIYEIDENKWIKNIGFICVEDEIEYIKYQNRSLNIEISKNEKRLFESSELYRELLREKTILTDRKLQKSSLGKALRMQLPTKERILIMNLKY